jgi:uroporphyrinogen decarboxylase
MKNDLILRVLKGEKSERKPVWMMRQAGRILPEYRALREKAKNFKDLIKNPELAAEITIQPVDRLEVDAAIIFSDILVVPEAMGLNYEMVENKGPLFPDTINGESDLSKLKVADPEADLDYVLEAIRITKKELDGRVPLIGFAGAPWTIFAYMIEGKGSKTFSKARKVLYTHPEFAHRLLEKITRSTILYLNAQAKAGADVVQIFDSWAGILPPAHYHEFSLRYIEDICREMSVPVIVFGKGAGFALEDMANLSCQAIGLDWNTLPQVARKAVGTEKILQGNLDPCALYSSFDSIRTLTKKMLRDFGSHHIANLGHGVYPDVHVDNARCFVDTVKEWEIGNNR